MARSKKKNKGLPILVNIAAFDTREPVVRHIADDVALNDVKGITTEDYAPWGGTPLNDAVLKFGEALDKKYRSNPDALHIGLLADESGSMAHLQLDVIEGFNTFVSELKNDDEPTTEPGVIMVIMTDGEENSSHETTGEDVQAWIKARELDGWNFFYLGANQDAWSTGEELGLGVASASFNYTADSAGHRHAMGTVTQATKLRKTTDSGVYASALEASIPDVMTYDQPDVDTTPKVTTPTPDSEYKTLASNIASKIKTGE